MLKLIEKIYGDKITLAYSEEGLFIEEGVVLKIIYNILLKDVKSCGIHEYTFFQLSQMLENIKCGVLKAYDNYDAINVENGCIIYTNLPQDCNFYEYVETMNNIYNRLEEGVVFFDQNIEDEFKIFVLSPTKPLIKSKISNKNNLKPTTKEELKELVNDESIYLGDIDTSLITDMSWLFYDCKRTDFSGINEWDTSKVLNMSGMFAHCYYFNEELSFDTSCVVDMSFMFADSNFNNKLSFNTSNVKDMKFMFFICDFNQKLEFDTSNVKDMRGMFAGCLDFNQLLKFNTSNVEDMSVMFSCCEKFNQKLAFDTSNVKDMSDMFRNCFNFNQKIEFDTKNVENMKNMFYYCKSFNQKLEFNTSKIENFFQLSNMFDNCPSLKTLPKFYLKYLQNTF